MPKLQGNQLLLLMPVADRPRSEWVDMHCPLLSGVKVGDRVYVGGYFSGVLEISEPNEGERLGKAVLRANPGEFHPNLVFNRRVCQDAETKQLKRGDRVRYPAGEAEIYYAYSQDFSLGGTKFVWLPRDPNFSSYMPVPLPLVSLPLNGIQQPLNSDRQNDAAPQAEQDHDELCA